MNASENNIVVLVFQSGERKEIPAPSLSKAFSKALSEMNSDNSSRLKQVKIISKSRTIARWRYGSDLTWQRI